MNIYLNEDEIDKNLILSLSLSPIAILFGNLSEMFTEHASCL